MKIAITGGIGSGKSFVCKCLNRRGIDVYDCDTAAKRLMRESVVLQRQLRQLVGNSVYAGGVLQKRVLASFILQSNEHAQQVDNIIHPAVAHDFTESGLDWLESAIFFDSGFYKRVPIDIVICVSAPTDVRISRIMKRDGISHDKAIEWINRQLPQDEVRRRSDYEITNDGTNNIEIQIDKLLGTLNIER